MKIYEPKKNYSPKNLSRIFLIDTRLSRSISMLNLSKSCRFSASIENTFREICLIEMVGTTLIMCLIEYSLITVILYIPKSYVLKVMLKFLVMPPQYSPIKCMNYIASYSQEWNNSDSIAIFTYFFLFVSFVFNIFIFCYIGELLIEQVLIYIYIFYIKLN